MHGLIFDLSLPFRQVQPGSCGPAIVRTSVLLPRSFYSVRLQFSFVWPGETPSAATCPFYVAIHGSAMALSRLPLCPTKHYQPFCAVNESTVRRAYAFHAVAGR